MDREEMVGVVGFEPTTLTPQRSGSTTELHPVRPGEYPLAGRRGEKARPKTRGKTPKHLTRGRFSRRGYSTGPMSPTQNLLDKVWDAHTVRELPGGQSLFFCVSW